MREGGVKIPEELPTLFMDGPQSESLSEIKPPEVE